MSSSGRREGARKRDEKNSKGESGRGGGPSEGITEGRPITERKEGDLRKPVEKVEVRGKSFQRGWHKAFYPERLGGKWLRDRGEPRSIKEGDLGGRYMKASSLSDSTTWEN